MLIRSLADCLTRFSNHSRKRNEDIPRAFGKPFAFAERAWNVPFSSQRATAAGAGPAASGFVAAFRLQFGAMMAILAVRYVGCRFFAGWRLSAILLCMISNYAQSGEGAETISDVRGLTFSADAKMLAVSSESGPLIRKWPSRRSGDSSKIVGLLDMRTLSQWVVVLKETDKDNQPPWSRNRNWTASVAFTSDGSRLYVINRLGGQVRSWDIVTRRWSNEPVINETNILDFSLSPDGKLLATRDRSHDVTIWDTMEWKELMAHPHWGLPAFSNDGQRLAVSTPAGVQVWNPITQELIATFPESQEALKQVAIGVGVRVESTVRCVALSPDGNSIAAKNVEGLSMFSIRTGKTRVLLPEIYEARRIERGSVVKSNPRETTLGVAFSPDGELLAAWGAYGTKFFDMSKGGKLQRSDPERVSCLAFSPDGTTYATGDSKGKVAICDTATGKELRSTVLRGDARIP